MRKLIAGNWKMNGLAGPAQELARAVRSGYGADRPFAMLVAPPFTALTAVIATLKGSPIAVAGQDCHTADSGAHTGDISAAMLADAGCSHVIVGHSERRTDHGESDAVVNAKAAAALAAGLRPIVCIGETEAERDAGKALEVCRRQIAGSVPDAATAETIIIAYEPVWAIGTGRTPTPDDVAEVHADIRAALGQKLEGADRVPLLYGGSVKPGNAGDLLTLPNVDGALVGGASLKAEDFLAIGANATT